MRSVVRVSALVATLLLLATQVPPVAAGAAADVAAAADPGAATDVAAAVGETGLATVQIGSVTPSLVSDGRLVFDGVVRNTGTTALTTVQAYVRRQLVPVTGTTALDDALRDTAPLPGADLLVDRYVDLSGDLAPGASVPVHLDLRVADLGLAGVGVYPVDLEIRATTPDSSRLAVAAERVALPLVPEGRRLPVTAVVPLSDRPHRLSRTVFVDDDLAASLGPTGRLGRVLAAVTGPLATPARAQLVLDPMLLEEVTAMAGGYRVVDEASAETTGTSAGLPPAASPSPSTSPSARSPTSGSPPASPPASPAASPPTSPPRSPAGSPSRSAASRGAVAALPPALADEDLHAEHTRAGTGSAVARDWLSRLTATATGRTVLLLPWGDPDPGTTGTARLAAAVARGAAVARAAGLVTRPLGWPSTSADGLVDPRGLGATARTGGLALVSSASLRDIPGTAVPASPTVPGGPVLAAAQASPVRPVADTAGLRVLRSDASLDRTLTAPGSSLQRRQELLGQAAVLAVAVQHPAPVLLTLPADWDPARTPVALLTPGLPGTGWVVPATELGGQQPGVAVTPSTSPGPADPTVAVASVTAVAARRATGLAARSTGFTSVLTQPQAVTDGFALMATQLLSRGWAGRPGDFDAFSRAAGRTLDGLTSAVSVPAARAVTLSSTQGRFPITVTNSLRQRVRVTLRLEPLNTVRLDIQPTDRPVDVAPAGSTTVSVRALARTNGNTEVVATVTTGDGVPLGPATRFGVRAQHYDTVGWVVIGVASTLLFGATAVRVVRRVRAARRRPA